MRWIGVVLGAVLAAGALGQTADVPLLRSSKGLGLIYSEVDPSVRAPVDQAWSAALTFGINAYQLAVPWDEMALPDGTPDLIYVTGLLDQLDGSGIQTFLTIQSVDTTALRLPADLLDPNNPRRLRPGLSFDSPEVIQPFVDLLTELAPVVADRGGFFISLANEVDIWLSINPDQAFPLAVFCEWGRQTVHAVEPRLRTGVTLTRDAIAQPDVATLFVSVSDAATFSYYPVEGVVLDPAVFAADLDAIEALAGGKPVMIQEFGCPSGPASGPSVIGASDELQRRWIGAAFREVRARPAIRFFSVLHIADWPPPVIEFFEDYYGYSDPGFLEFLSTLGLMDTQGNAKPALGELLYQLRLTRQVRPEPAEATPLRAAPR